MPAWIAGTKARRDASGDIHVNLIPALHAEMTQSRGSALTKQGLSWPYFNLQGAM
jgi:hypothetical protein